MSNINLQDLAERVYNTMMQEDMPMNSTVVSSFVKLLEMANIHADNEIETPEIHIHFTNKLPK